MRVLDVGSGMGSVSMLASDLVGPEGAVVGVEYSAPMAELSSRRAQGANKGNVTFVQGDIESTDLPGPFDAIVGRFILRELKDASRSLRRLSRQLVPGGILAFQEKVLSIPVTSQPPMRTVDKVRGWMDDARRRAGVEVSTGARLPQIFVGAGLPPPELRLDAPVGYGPSWLGYDYLVETLRGMLPLMHLYGIASEEELSIETLADKMRTEAAELASVVILTPCIGAWMVRRSTKPRATRRRP